MSGKAEIQHHLTRMVHRNRPKLPMKFMGVSISEFTREEIEALLVELSVEAGKHLGIRRLDR